MPSNRAMLKSRPFVPAADRGDPTAIPGTGSHAAVLDDRPPGIRRNIIGSDDRQPANDASFPHWRMICHLVIQSRDGHRYTGTGWLAGPSTVVTAGHNLLLDSIGHVAERVWVIPGRQGDDGHLGLFEVTSFAVHAHWKQGQQPGFDIGVIWLPEPVGGKLGYFGFASLADGALANAPVLTAGYPDDKAFGTQWVTQSRVNAVFPHTLRYGLDTVHGQSGSPVFAVGSAGPVAVATHVYGAPQANEGVRLSPDIVETLTHWWR